MNEGRTKKTLRNALYAISNQAVSLVLSFVSRSIFIYFLGKEYLGISGVFADVLAMLSLADLGLGTAMVYSFYKPIADNDQRKIAALVNFYRKIYNAIAAIVAAVGLAIIPFLKYIINLDNPIPYINVYYVLFLANTVVSYLFVYKSAIINADQKSYLVSKYQIIINFTKIVLQCVVLFLTRNYVCYLLVQIIATILNNMIISRRANELYPFIRDYRGKIEKKERDDIKENIFSVVLYKVATVIFGATDNTLISMIVGTVWVGIYSNYSLVITTLSGFINVLYTSVTASIGNAVLLEKSEKRYEIFRSMQVISLMIAMFTTICLSNLFNDLLYVWLGSDFVLNESVVAAVIINFYVMNVLHPIWSFREATGLYKQTKYIMLIATLENIVLSVLLGMKWGMAGIFAATVIARLTTYFWYEPRLLFKKYFEVKVWPFYSRMMINAVITGMIVLGVRMLTGRMIVESWLALFIKTAVVVIISMIAVVLVYRKSDGYRVIVNKIKFR